MVQNKARRSRNASASRRSRRARTARRASSSRNARRTRRVSMARRQRRSRGGSLSRVAQKSILPVSLFLLNKHMSKKKIPKSLKKKVSLVGGKRKAKKTAKRTARRSRSIFASIKKFLR